MGQEDFDTACKFIIFGWFTLPFGIAIHFGPWLGLAVLGAESLVFGAIAAIAIKMAEEPCE